MTFIIAIPRLKDEMPHLCGFPQLHVEVGRLATGVWRFLPREPNHAGLSRTEGFPGSEDFPFSSRANWDELVTLRLHEV